MLENWAWWQCWSYWKKVWGSSWILRISFWLRCLISKFVVIVGECWHVNCDSWLIFCWYCCTVVAYLRKLLLKNCGQWLNFNFEVNFYISWFLVEVFISWCIRFLLEVSFLVVKLLGSVLNSSIGPKGKSINF